MASSDNDNNDRTIARSTLATYQMSQSTSMHEGNRSYAALIGRECNIGSFLWFQQKK